MALAQLQAFVGHIRRNKILEQGDIIRVVKQMVQLDRRLGLMAVSRGYLKAEHVNLILNTLLQKIELKFGEAAVQLNLLTPAQVDEILKLQKNDLFMFSQAAIMTKVATPEQMAKILKSYLAVEPQVDEPVTENKEGAAMGRKVRDVLQSVKSVAAMPGPAQKVLEMLQDPEADIDKVAKVISLEPTLVATILRIVNSAFYGMRARVNTVSQAMVVLGLKKIRQIILTAGVMQKFQDIPTSVALKIWDHSILTGQWAKELAARLSFKETEEFFISGLVHNVGEMVVVQYFPNEYKQIQAQVKAGKSQNEAERQAIGGTHADIGAFVFGMWQLSSDTIQATMFHHHPLAMLDQVKDLSKHAIILNLSVAIADSVTDVDSYEGMARSEQLYENYKPLLENVDIDVGAMYTRVDAAVRELKKIFA